MRRSGNPTNASAYSALRRCLLWRVADWRDGLSRFSTRCRVPCLNWFWFALAADVHGQFCEVNKGAHEGGFDMNGRGISGAIAISYVLEVKNLGKWRDAVFALTRGAFDVALWASDFSLGGCNCHAWNLRCAGVEGQGSA